MPPLWTLTETSIKVTKMPGDKDIVCEARELLETELPDSVHSIEHALWADAIERQSESPFWGHSKAIATAYARAPKLLRALADEVEARRSEVKTLELTIGGLLARLGHRNED